MIMDTFFEQLVAIKKTAKTWALFLLIWVACLAVIAAAFIFLFGYLGMYVILLAFGALYGAYRLSMLLSVEYEYIITNGSMDIDKITAQSSRKRVASFELSEVQSLEKYNPAGSAAGVEKRIFACNGGEDAYTMRVSKKNGGTIEVVFAPNERMREAALKFLPKFIANTAFKD